MLRGPSVVSDTQIVKETDFTPEPSISHKIFDPKKGYIVLVQHLEKMVLGIQNYEIDAAQNNFKIGLCPR